MATKKYVDMLQRGTFTWNTWRGKHPNEKIDLSRANLSFIHLGFIHLGGADLREADLGEADLYNANLHNANLYNANLRNANLRNANLRNAILGRAILSGADLYNTDLSGADLYNTDLSGANLRNANFSETNLSRADLSGANLYNTDLSRAYVGWTIFGSLDLRTVKGLETMEHHGPSEISISTLERSNGALPDIFLREVGLSDEAISYARSFLQHPIEYYSCFLSYSSKDEEFAKRLYADLQSNGVRCWFAPHSMRPGTVIVRGIDEAIRLYDKLLLILSQHSVESTWVEFEVAAALEKEKEQQNETLFPIRLDDTILATNQAWAAGIRRQRHIGNFTQWKDHDTYQQVFNRLLHDLKTSVAKER